MAYEIYDDCYDKKHNSWCAASLNRNIWEKNILIGSSPHECHCDASFCLKLLKTNAFKILKDYFQFPLSINLILISNVKFLSRKFYGKSIFLSTCVCLKHFHFIHETSLSNIYCSLSLLILLYCYQWECYACQYLRCTHTRAS